MASFWSLVGSLALNRLNKISSATVVFKARDADFRRSSKSATDLCRLFRFSPKNLSSSDWSCVLLHNLGFGRIYSWPAVKLYLLPASSSNTSAGSFPNSNGSKGLSWSLRIEKYFRRLRRVRLTTKRRSSPRRRAARTLHGTLVYLVSSKHLVKWAPCEFGVSSTTFHTIRDFSLALRGTHFIRKCLNRLLSDFLALCLRDCAAHFLSELNYTTKCSRDFSHCFYDFGSIERRAMTVHLSHTLPQLACGAPIDAVRKPISGFQLQSVTTIFSAHGLDLLQSTQLFIFCLAAYHCFRVSHCRFFYDVKLPFTFVFYWNPCQQHDWLLAQ